MPLQRRNQRRLPLNMRQGHCCKCTSASAASRELQGLCSEQAVLALQGRNRRCLTLDLRQEAGRDICRQLADRADVLVENFRPGVMEKWGLGPKVSAWALAVLACLPFWRRPCWRMLHRPAVLPQCMPCGTPLAWLPQDSLVCSSSPQGSRHRPLLVRQTHSLDQMVAMFRLQ